MAEFVVGSHTYRSGKLDGMTQFHVLRRLTPVVAALVEARQSLVQAKVAPADGSDEGGEAPKPEASTDTLAAIAIPIAKAVGAMSDEDSEYVLNKCFAVVSRRQGTEAQPTWSLLYRKGAGLMFNDLSALEMLAIAQQVIQENIGPFGPGNAFTSIGARAAA